MSDEPYAVSSDFLAPIGAIVHWFARHEVLMQVTMAGILRIDIPSAMAITTGHHYAGKRNALLSLLRVAPLPEGQAEKIKSLAGSLHGHNKLRNAVSHHLMTRGQRTGSIKPFHMSVSGGDADMKGLSDDETDYTADELITAADALADNYNKWAAFLHDSGLERRIEEKIDIKSETTSSSPGNPPSK